MIILEQGAQKLMQRSIMEQRKILKRSMEQEKISRSKKNNENKTGSAEKFKKRQDKLKR